MQKRGLSTIIVTLILILVSLVAVGIVWVVVRNIIQTGTEGVGLSQFSLSAKILDVAIDNSSNNISLTVKRNAGEGELEGISFIFSNSNADTEVVTRSVSLKELEQMKFNFHLINVSVSDLISVSIVPLIKQDGKQISGIALDKYNLGNNKNNFPSQTACIPTNCSALGYQCGTWNNGTCAGTFNCGTCSGGQTCNSTGRCVTSCVPATCAGLGYECGTGYVNGTCSGTLNCGTCGTGTCNASGRCVVQTGSTCGNNLVDSGEACDGTNMSGYTCATVAAGYASGTLSCSSDCKGYITTSCVAGNTRTAASCSQTDVQNQINLAIEGDIINVPAGNCIWETLTSYPGSNYRSPVRINKSIFLKGAGIGRTNITSRVPYAWDTVTLHLIIQTGKPIRISGFTFIDYVYNGAVIIQSEGDLKNSRIDHNNFYNGSTQILPAGMKGVIDYNNFYNADIDISFTAGSSAQAIASWASLEAGTGAPLFIENNHFIDDAGFSATYGNEKIGTFNGGKLVIRYNHFDGTNFPLSPATTFTPIQTHGSAAGGVPNGYWQIGTGARRGQSVVEIYSNLMEGKRIDFPMIIRGSANLIYNNSVILSGGYAPRVYMYEEEPDGGQWVPARTGWPAEDQVHNTFIWSNTYNGGQMGPSNIAIGGATYIQENRDYFLHRPATIGEGMTLGKETFTGANGASSSYPTDGSTWPTLGTMVFTPGVENAYYGYVPYPYPHPVALIP